MYSVLECCDILEKHNKTGLSVMKLTSGTLYESKCVEIIIQACRDLIKENAQLSKENEILNTCIADWRRHIEEK